MTCPHIKKKLSERLKNIQTDLKNKKILNFFHHSVLRGGGVRPLRTCL